MKEKLLTEGTERTYALVLDTGDEVLQQLKAFAARHKLSAARISGIGAFESLMLGFFERDRKEYLKIKIREQVEVLSLLGDISISDEKPKVHVHVVVGKKDGTAHGGHLLEAHVWPTLEVMVIESPAYLRRKFDPEAGLPLIDLEAG
jgi:uncharacterized protein